MPKEKESEASEIAVEIGRLAESMKRLRELGVIRSQKIVGDVGEWIAAALFDGFMANAKNQKGWDIICEAGNIQVRAHAKAEGNRTRWTSIKGLPDDCAELAIVVLTQEFRIFKVFRVPTADAKLLAKKERLSWSRLDQYEINLSDLPSYSDLTPLFASQ